MAYRILVTGASGQVGQAFQELADTYPTMEFLFLDRKTLDIGDAEQIEQSFSNFQPTHCINCAAYTAVDRAESEPEQAKLINVDAVALLAKACLNIGAHFWHFSSDYVYDNSCNRPLKETDPTEPKSVYAQTKLAGELAALEVLPNTTIIRTSWVYASSGQNFVKTMLRLGAKGNPLKVVVDQVGAPTFAKDLARTSLDIIQQYAPTQLGGIFNYAPSGVCSWYDFAKAIFRIKDIHCTVAPIPSTGYPTPASRPNYSILDTHKIRETFGISLPYWQDSLKSCLKEV